MPSKLDLNSLILDFIEYCEVERGLSPRTAEKYAYRLGRFQQWAKDFLHKESLQLSDLDLELIRKFRVHLNRFELKNSTRYNYLVTMRSLLKFLVKHDYKTVEPEKVDLGRHMPARSLKFLKPDELEQLLNKPDTRKVMGVRDRAILEVLFSTGLRVSELAALNRGDIDLDRREFSVVGKGSRRRVVFLSDQAVEWLEKYINGREDDFLPLFIKYSGPDSAVLPDSKTTTAARLSKGSRIDEAPATGMKLEIDDPTGERLRLNVRSIQRLVKKYTRQAGLVVDVTPHVLRHSFATDLLMAGADLRTVQESLGHKNVSTTQIYTHITNLQLKKAHQKFHGKWRGKE